VQACLPPEDFMDEVAKEDDVVKCKIATASEFILYSYD